MSKIAYHLTLWAGTLLTFLLLDFSKHVDDVMYGLTLGELALNFLAATPLAWVLSLFLASLSAKAEQAGHLRTVHFFVIFCFTTVNVWSIKIGLAPQLSKMITPTRSMWAWLSLILVLLFSAGLARRKPDRYKTIDTQSTLFLKWMAAACLLCSIGVFDLPDAPNEIPSDAPNVILVTFDAMSAENMSVYGYARQTTPNIQKWAEESWVFDNAYCNYNFTAASITSLNGNLIERNDGPKRSSQRGLFEILRTNGYPHQGFFSYSSAFFKQRFRGHSITLSGKKTMLWRAWRHLFSDDQLVWLANLLSEELSYYWPYTSDYDEDSFWEKNHRPGDLSFGAALNFLSEHPSGAFVWIHLWEPHYPYWPDADLKDKFGPVIPSPAQFIDRPYHDGQLPWVESLRNRYDQNVFTADRLFGQFVEDLRKEGLYDDSWLILSADHGESFNDGYIGHSGPSVLEAVTHIPLIIRSPGNTKPKRIATVANQIDLAPTLLELLGIASVPTLPGESLVPYINNPMTQSERARFTVSYSVMQNDPSGEIAVYYQNYKAVFLNADRQNVRLYDLANDPGTKHDIAKDRPEILETTMKKGGLW